MDQGGLLRSLDFGKYEAVFRENDIDETVLPSLTHENLKELGVASFGHRVELLDAIAALHSDASGKAPSVDAATVSSSPSARPEDRAERRQVTVMFSDLMDSTALSARMDPEDLRHSFRPIRSASLSRFDALHASGLTELVGREETGDGRSGCCSAVLFFVSSGHVFGSRQALCDSSGARRDAV
jgi:hypothetical protein